MRSPFGLRSGIHPWHFGRGVFSPATLFAGGEVGVWYDPSPETTFTDTAGTTPATVGDAVALMLDKSKGLVLGPELVTNGTFDVDTDWTKSGWTISTGAASYDGTVTANSITQSISAAVGKLYAVTFDVTFGSGANEALVVSLESTLPLTKSVKLNKDQGDGTYTFFLVCVEQILRFNANRTEPSGNLFSGTIDNISVRELPGYHATQGTTAARPILARVPERGRVNLLTRTEEFGDAYWSKSGVTLLSGAESPFGGASTRQQATGSGAAFIFKTNVAVSLSTAHTLSLFAKAGNVNFICFELDDFTTPATNTRAWFNLSTGEAETVSPNIDSTHVEDFGDGWYRVAVTFTTGATDALGTIGWFPTTTNGSTSSIAAGNYIDVLGAQLEEGSTASAYQKVTSTYDVTEAGQADNYFLWFDGIDDSLVTPTITPGIDKVQVFAGVRKLWATGFPMLLETSVQADVANNDGAIYLLGSTVGGAAGWAFNSRGTLPARPSAPGVYALNVITGLGDISGDSATIRIDGTQAAQVTTDQGTGNYLAYPMYIGSRAGTSLYFNGHLYSLITRFGANLGANTITQTEKYISTKTAGVDL